MGKEGWAKLVCAAAGMNGGNWTRTRVSSTVERRAIARDGQGQGSIASRR